MYMTTPLSLTSPEPLPGRKRNNLPTYLIWGLIGLGIGLFFFIVLLLTGDIPSAILALFMVPLLGLGIGWGFADKGARWDVLALRQTPFLLPVPIPYQELGAKLYQSFAHVNIPVSLTQEGKICVNYHGLNYIIVYDNEQIFRIVWTQSFGKALFNRGFYNSLYKKVVADMGYIGYCIQQISQASQSNVQVCPHCHTPLTAKVNFCTSCGSPITN